MNMGVQMALEDSISTVLGYILRSGIAGSCGSSLFHFSRALPTLLPSGCSISLFNHQCMSFIFSTFRYCFKIIVILIVHVVESQRSFNVHSLVVNEVVHFSMCLLAYIIYGKASIRIFCPFFYWILFYY